MAFNSLQYLCFLPLAVLGYYVLPHKIRYIWLLVCSYFFYMQWSIKYSLLILGVTLVTYTYGLVFDRLATKSLKIIGLFMTGLVCFGILGYFKYTSFLLSTINNMFTMLGSGAPFRLWDIILPVGVSFFTFQAFSYAIDVYRGDVEVEKNFFKYALFVSFFPQLVAGPIEKSKDLLRQISEEHRFNYDEAKEGFYLILWGLFMKMVIADRCAMIVDKIYGDSASYPGIYLIIATVLFAFQIYCDFGGYSIIAYGSAKILGFRLTENFRSPYMSQSPSEFWNRWHISLFNWFRDYIYIPLGGNRRGRLIKCCNILIVFLISGIWHGASWAFVAWGLINGLYQVVQSLIIKKKDKNIARKFSLLKMLGTFILIDFAWIFFRAGTMAKAVECIGSMLNINSYTAFRANMFLEICSGYKEALALLISLVILIAVDACNNNGVMLRRKLMVSSSIIQVIVVSLAVIILAIWGIYGTAYDAQSFIYFSF